MESVRFQPRSGLRPGYQGLLILLAVVGAYSAARTLPRVKRGLKGGYPREIGSSDRINAGIAAAIQAGEHEYVLPAGNIPLNKPIVIPPGATDFTIRGQGSSGTTLTTTQPLSEAIQIGQPVQLHNNWGLTNHPNLHVGPVREGQRSIQLFPGERPRANHYYVLWDTHTEGANNDTKTVVMNHAEIVRVTSAHGDTADLDEPTAREYDASAQLADVDRLICRNIKVQGIGFNGATGLSKSSRSLLAAYWVEGMEVSDTKIRNYETNALYFVNSRHITVSHADISGATTLGPGGGYGVALSRCRFALVTDSEADQSRHGFIAHAGTTDATFQRCACQASGFDAHGMDERRLQFLDCKADGTLQVGNQAWPEGDRQIEIRNCQFGGGLNVCARTRDLQATDSDFGLVAIWSDVTGYQNPSADQAPDGIHLVHCRIIGQNDLIKAHVAAPGRPVRVGTIEFRDCEFESTRRQWGSAIEFKDLSGHLIFDGCRIACDSERGDVPIQLSSPYQDLFVELNRCEVRSSAANCAAVVHPGFAGLVSLVGNRYHGGRASRPVFLKNLGGVNVREAENRADGG